MEVKGTNFPGPDNSATVPAPPEVTIIQNAEATTPPEEFVQVCDLVLLNLKEGQGARPALVIAKNADLSLDLCVFWNGPKDYVYTGNTETTQWMTAIIHGEEEGQWKFRQ